jgi:DNA polymerase-3 subunit gamma/tau
MASQVLYRKWRPQTLADVVGQQHVTRTLVNALLTDRLAHAYLFCGPRGTGKTSTGRILAKAVNCLSHGDGEPCNTCSMCTAITEGRALDLVEIDGASNRGIDEIRDIREKINFAPNAAKYKVYIIDEVHMLTEPAFNALLKTLEEPPPHAIFVLATTEVHKVPLTILSRCQRFDFRRLSQADVVGKLQRICDQEEIDIDPQVLPLVAKAATGSLRDAENILEQLVLQHPSGVGLDEVRAELGFTDDDRVRQLASCILSDDIPAGLATIGSVAADGLDLRLFNRSLVEYLRTLLLVRAGAADAADLPAEAVADMRQLVERKALNELTRTIKLFAQIDFRLDPRSTLPLELALVDSSLPAPEKPVEPETKVMPRPVVRTAPPKTIKEPPPKELEPAGSAVDTVDVQPSAPAPDQAVADAPLRAGAASMRPAEVPIPPPPHTVEQIRQYWNDFVKACRGMGSSGNLDALLRNSCDVADLDGDTLVLDFRHEWHRSKIEDPKYRHQVEVKLQQVFGVPYKVRCTHTPKAKDSRPSQRESNPVVSAALEMGARIIEEEQEDE